MKYREIRKNAFEEFEGRTQVKDTFLVHCISADFALGAGFAKEVNRRYETRNILKRMYPEYANAYDKFSIKGDCLRAYDVLNLVTKRNYWNKPTYDTLRAALTAMRELFDPHKQKVYLVMPRIGCGLDRLEWEKVSGVIKEVFDGYNFDITVCVI